MSCRVQPFSSFSSFSSLGHFSFNFFLSFALISFSVQWNIHLYICVCCVFRFHCFRVFLLYFLNNRKKNTEINSIWTQFRCLIRCCVTFLRCWKSLDELAFFLFFLLRLNFSFWSQFRWKIFWQFLLLFSFSQSLFRVSEIQFCFQLINQQTKSIAWLICNVMIVSGIILC